jgi:hypothetical protein
MCGSERDVVRREWRNWVLVFGNRVLWRMCGSERDGVRREWRKLNNEEQ